MRKVAVYGGTKEVYHDMTTAAKSLLRYTPVDKVYFLTEGNFCEELPAKVECVDVSGQKYFPADGPNYKSAWTYMTLMRIALPLLLKEDRVLWLDVDTICLEDISDLFETDLCGCYVGAVEEPGRSKDPFLYFNAGVLLMDLKKLRPRKAREMVDFVNSKKLKFPDQDVINILCQGKIKPLPSGWNSCNWTAKDTRARIKHFAAINDYRNYRLYKENEASEWRSADENT